MATTTANTTDTKAPVNPRGPRRPEIKERQVAQTRQTKAVRAYLESLKGLPRQRGRGNHLTAEAADVMIKQVSEKLESNHISQLERLRLLERRRQLMSVTDSSQFIAVEQDFIAHAKAFSDRENISRDTWREMDVPPRVLKAAGIN